MADIKQVKVDNTTYNIKDEVARQQLATKQPLIESVSSTYEENGGNPSAVASTDENGNLAFNFQNLKLKFSDLTADDKAELKGDQGDSAVYDPDDPNTPDFEMANTTGQSTTKAMTQKAVTDELTIYEDINISNLTEYGTYINSSNIWNSSVAGRACIFVPVVGGSVIQVMPNVALTYAFLTSSSYTTTTSVSTYAEGYTGTVVANQSAGMQVLQVPSDARFLYIVSKWESNDRKPSVFRCAKSSVKDAISTIQSDVINVESDLDDLKFVNTKITSGYTTMNMCAFVAQGWSNNVSTDACRFYPVTPGNIYRIGLDTNKTWHAFFVTKKDYSVGDMPSTGLATGESSATKTGWVTKTAPSDAAYLYVRSKMANTAWDCPEVWLRDEIKDYVEKIGDEVEKNNRNKMSLVKAAKWYSPSVTAHWPILGLMHYSDIHASSTAANEIKQALVQYNSYINDVLCTGDVVRLHVNYTPNSSDDLSDGLGWWNSSGLAEISLLSLGNHDCSEAINPGLEKDMAWCHDAYYAEHIAELGYVMPDGYDDSESPNYKATYWHKDYTQQKIRLICIDAPHHFDGCMSPSTGEITKNGQLTTSNAQELWLMEKLNETLANSGNSAAGYSVIIASHFALDDYGVTEYYGAAPPYNSVTGDKDNKTWNDSTHVFDVNKNTSGGRVVDSHTGDIANFHDMSSGSFVADHGFHLRDRDNYGVAYRSNYNNIGEIIKYWMENNFVEVSDTTNKNPRTLGWYELVDGEYKFTSDTTPNNEKTYYTGAKFVAWFSGHTHRDYMFYSQMFPNILNIGVAQAGERRDEYTFNRNDVCLTANLVFIDTYYHYIKLIRIGNNNRWYLRPINYLSYNYVTRQVVSQG